VVEENLWSITPLAERHLREPFHCGVAELDEFLKRYARQNDERGISRTYVATRGGDLRVLGYYTLRAGAVAAEDLPPAEVRRLPRYPVPVVHLARLAVDRTVAGEGLGALLLVSSLARAQRISQEIGAYAVEVMAKTEGAALFYEKFGFRRLADDRLHLYLSMKTVAKLLR